MLKLNNKVGYNFNRPAFLFILLVVVSVINSVSLQYKQLLNNQPSHSFFLCPFQRLFSKVCTCFLRSYSCGLGSTSKSCHFKSRKFRLDKEIKGVKNRHRTNSTSEVACINNERVVRTIATYSLFISTYLNQAEKLTKAEERRSSTRALFTDGGGGAEGH